MSTKFSKLSALIAGAALATLSMTFEAEAQRHGGGYGGGGHFRGFQGGHGGMRQFGGGQMRQFGGGQMRDFGGYARPFDGGRMRGDFNGGMRSYGGERAMPRYAPAPPQQPGIQRESQGGYRRFNDGGAQTQGDRGYTMRPRGGDGDAARLRNDVSGRGYSDNRNTGMRNDFNNRPGTQGQDRGRGNMRGDFNNQQRSAPTELQQARRRFESGTLEGVNPRMRGAYTERAWQYMNRNTGRTTNAQTPDRCNVLFTRDSNGNTGGTINACRP